MSSSESSYLLPFILISSAAVCGCYLFITTMLTDSINKANSKPQVEELTTALDTLGSTQEAAKSSENQISTPLNPVPKKAQLTTAPTSSSHSSKNRRKRKL